MTLWVVKTQNETATAASKGTRSKHELIFMLTKGDRCRVNSHSSNPLYSANGLSQEIEVTVKPPGVLVLGAE